eukprot:CAMPEP_0119007328 /NCGR_PEP_ID=MMETSP1176-20130426/2938_1 /TAXON_ID=265551 /ORGANISM="Synedropsis recta cf, Strain CCMP1620" /LENGTH=382 /DNA_ID=CAMNT_0006959451 /DNA_START=27 /DNA_END=1175 /DNA_ORIENTATION=-
MVTYQHPPDEKQDLLNCCKVLAIALFGWLAVHIALLPFESGAFTPSNPDLDMNRNGSSLWDLETSKQRIVLIVGNNEVLQQNILQWTRAPHVLPSWAYPIPTREDLEALDYAAPPRYKSFDPLFATLRNDPFYYRPESTNNKMKPDVVESVVNLYKGKADSAWNSGKNLVIASAGARLDASALEKWIKTLPEGSSPEDVQVIVTYKSPRHQQLIQAWQTQQQQLGPNTKNTTLTEFVRTGQLKHHFDEMMNSLGSAEVFVKKGMQTIIIDEKGLQRERVDLSTAVGCLVLKVRCNTNGIVGDYHREVEPPKNVNGLDMSESKLKQIEKVLQDFDCGLFDILSKPSNVHFLYREALFRTCSALSRQITAKEAIRRIEAIAKSP